MLIAFLLLLLGCYIALHFPAVQTWLTKQVANKLSKELNTRVRVDHVDFQFFKNLSIDGVLIEDHSNDTLLYAGNARLKISDWFFLKDHITIYNVSLSNGVINLNRSDSTWNYQFLIDYFSGGSKSGNKGNQTKIDLKEVHLSNIRINRTDQWIGQNMHVSLTRADVVVDQIRYNQQVIRVKDVYLEDPAFSIYDYHGKRPRNPDQSVAINEQKDNSSHQWNDLGWEIQVKEIRMFNGSVASDKQTERAPFTNHFDGLHLKFGSISGNIKDLSFRSDTLAAHLKLSTKERSGFSVNKIESDFRFTPDIMEFSNLDITTPYSHVGNYYAMKYRNFNEDMNDFIKSVHLEMHLDQSKIHSNDIAYFAPELKDWNREFMISGLAKGSIENFTVQKLSAETGNSTLAGDLTMHGLPDINSTFIDYKGESLKTTYSDLITIIPTLRSVHTPDLKKLGNISYKGNFTGFWNDFVTFGTINTNLGVVIADLNMKLPQGANPSYSGKIITQGFRLGDFLNEKTLGIISLNGQVKGSGFTLSTLNADFDGHVSSLGYNHYNYQNIDVSGNFKRSLFTGNLSINDPNLQLKKLNGSLNLSGKELSFDAYADLQLLDLKSLGFSNAPMKIGGLMNLNFTGNNIDNFKGTASIYDAFISNDSTRVGFDSLILSSYYENEMKILSLKSNELEAELRGKFTVMELPDAFRFFLSRYYPAYITAHTHKLDPQDFDFYIKTNSINDYLSILNKSISGLSNSTIQGHLNLDQSELTVQADVPEFIYQGKKFQGIGFTGNGNADTLTADIRVNNIAVTDSLYFPSTTLQIKSHNDLSTVHLTTSAGEALNDAELNANIQTLKDGVKINFFPSTFIINNKKWTLDKDGEFTWREKFIEASEIRFQHDDQQLRITTEPDDVSNSTQIVARLENIYAEDFLPFVIDNPSLKGKITGTAKIRNPLGDANISFRGEADSFKLNDSYIGKVNIVTNVNTETGVVDFATHTDEDHYQFNFGGTYNYKDSTSRAIDINLLGKKVDLNILQPFLGSVFSKIQGVATTQLQVSGPTKHPYLTGSATIDSCDITIEYTQCKYKIKNQTIRFDKDLIDLGRISIADTLGNTGTLAGSMHHVFFNDFSFNGMRLETSKLLLLNTTKTDNSQFYGHVTGSALMTLNGPLTNLVMNIDGQPSVFDSSHIFLSTGESRESRVIDYIDFIQFGSLMADSVKTNESTNIVLNMNLVANPSCKIDVILDEETNDVVHGRGNGQLNIRVGNKEPLSIRGQYDITNGDYTFNFQTFLKKPFTLNEGSIKWTGDPYQAQINIQAEYLAKNVDISSLYSGQAKTDLPRKQDVTILSHLTGSLKKPDISFEFQLPEKSDASRDYIVLKKLEEFKNDPNEMNKQVASLLLFNSFISSEQNFISGGNTINVAASTIGGVVSGWLTGMLNKELQQATDGIITTYVDINPSLDLTQSANQLQANVRAGLQILLSRRLVILLGGNLDYNNNLVISQLQRKGLITPDISIEWLLNKDGSIRLVGFNRSSIDATVGQRNRSGIQLSYRKDFNRLSDIFKSKAKLESEEATSSSQKKETEK